MPHQLSATKTTMARMHLETFERVRQIAAYRGVRISDLLDEIVLPHLPTLRVVEVPACSEGIRQQK